MSNIYNSLSHLYNRPLSEMAKELGYSESNIYILQNNFVKLQKEYANVWKALISCKHNKDKRTYEEYAQDLVSSWLYEDTLLYYLKKFNFNIRLNGSDKNREILNNSKVLTDTDYIISKNNIERNIELINSYTPYWGNTKKIDLRDNKFKKMENNNVILLCIDIYNKIFYILDFKFETINATYINQHRPYGNKPAYQIDISRMNSYEFSIKNVAQSLLNILER